MSASSNFTSACSFRSSHSTPKQGKEMMRTPERGFASYYNIIYASASSNFTSACSFQSSHNTPRMINLSPPKPPSISDSAENGFCSGLEHGGGQLCGDEHGLEHACGYPCNGEHALEHGGEQFCCGGRLGAAAACGNVAPASSRARSRLSSTRRSASFCISASASSE